VHGGIAPLVDHLEFTSHPLERLGISKCLGSGIGHLLAGCCELLCQLLTPSHLFGMAIPVVIHEELRRRNVSETAREGREEQGC
jgi:hypothetical protein